MNRRSFLATLLSPLTAPIASATKSVGIMQQLKSNQYKRHNLTYFEVHKVIYDMFYKKADNEATTLR
jgi:hypothetical protein